MRSESTRAQRLKQRRYHKPEPQILVSVVFDLIKLNEFIQSHETISDIHAQVLDNCIAVIISRPVITENHLVEKILLYCM